MERLFTPGPVELPERVRGVLGRQIIHHRTEEFKNAFLEVRELFKRLLESPSENFVFFASSGTGAMEAAILNFFKEGDRVLVVNGGKFGERWMLLARHWGLEVIEYKLPLGKSADPDRIREMLREKPCKGVLFQISETSTGAFHPYKDIGKVCREFDTLCVADAITALGVYHIKPEEDNIDVIVGGSQKALLLPPGLSVIWFSERARQNLTDRAFYFSVSKELKKQVEGQTAWTPAISLILALKESLSMLLEETMPKVEKRHRLISEGTLQAVRVMGLEPFAENPAISVSAISSDQSEKIRKELLKLGIRVAGGQEELKGKIFRISHMGVDPKDALMLIGVLEVVLKKLGFPVELGSGVKAFSQRLLEGGLW
ncbi:pyridoxal-phosphate-dependent aminotransferase family protein [Thermocrinis minervae]|uniref:Aspartate aminotransferase n=1 Tax=Thermocrinis minervae TaxID=381751 RepID=A0A1M6RBL1_9AQUI|nr:alanine--glyoxylate aminotransferase family protein [Thermocrinis minervae]SHK29800.1 aspartate aminotransferase [Thermocrinis minervae]